MRKIFSGMFVILALLLAACQQNSPSTIDYSEIPQNGDAERGAQLFDQPINSAPQCSSCHNPAANAAPILEGFGAIAGERVAGEDAHEYTFYAITEPGRYVVEGFGNAMYNLYDEKMTEQQIADLIAYLLSL